MGEGNGRGTGQAVESGRASAVVAPAAEAAPYNLSAQADPVENPGAVVKYAGREHLLFPSPGSQLKPLEHLYNVQNTTFSVQPGGRGGMLPPEQEPKEFSGRYRRYLGAQSFDGGAVDTGKDAAVAKLLFGPAGREAAPQDRAFMLQPRYGVFDVGCGKAQHTGKFWGSERARAFDPAPDNGEDCIRSNCRVGGRTGQGRPVT